MSFLDGFEYRQLYYEAKSLCGAQSQVIENLQEDKTKLANQTAKTEERLKKVEDKLVKQELEISALKKDLEVQNKRNDMLESEIQKTREFRQRFEKHLGVLDTVMEKDQFEEYGKAKFQEDHR